MLCDTLRQHTRLLVTHQLQFLSHPAVSRVVVMSHGTVLHNDTYANLVQRGVTFASLRSGGDDDSAGTGNGSDPAVGLHHDADADDATPRSPFTPTPVADGRGGGDASDGTIDAGEGTKGDSSAPLLSADRAIEDEERFSGVVKPKVFRDYFWSMGGGRFVVLFAVVSVLLEVSKSGSTIWLSLWADKKGHLRPAAYLGVFVCLGVTAALLSLARNVYFFRGGVQASTVLHETMLGAVLRVPLSWISANPMVRRRRPA